MVEGSKQVRVDNWGIFFLQRLQIFFSKTDYCDLTLQFEGNVQLKVHRLVMNACTEYFTYLERTCPTLEEGTIMMPPDLQSDVIVPIVNFMYTGMLEFHISVFDKLYKAAEIMSITVLTKLLDAQRKPMLPKTQKRKLEDVISSALSVKPVPKVPSTPELPPTLPGRKVPVWKRKLVPSSQTDYHERWSSDPLIPDAAPKPTRFEWPDDDLPPLTMMESSFEEISYTSKPLLTQEDEMRAIPNAAGTSSSIEYLKQDSPSHNRKNMAKVIIDSSKEARARTKIESASFEEVILFGGEDYADIGQKRKADTNIPKPVAKKSKLGDKENKETSINVKANTSDLDHTKIVSEILKKYPNLVKKNKNIKLKIMPVATPPKKIPDKPIPGFHEIKRKGVKADSSTQIVEQSPKLKKKKEKTNLEGPWICKQCDGLPVEFVLYYLYRKHMTDVHNEVFDICLCKYCGQKCSKPNLMMYHLYTKHGLRPPASYTFPKCDQCPYIAISDSKLIVHKQRHQANEMQCFECKLAFSSQATLTAHLQITGHLNRPGKASFDCQYCTKKLQSAINLFSHIKNTHFKDAKRDGIVGLDELDETDDDDESEEEYIVPDVLSENEIAKDKVKIISNVKVPNKQNSNTAQNQQELVPLVQTTQANSLNNVTGSIATSLGLVDIVVLDENQQYILQENQEQTEFILPELTTGDSHFGAQVITTQHSNVLPQGVLQATGTDITSTDELVMVLTDHDYQEEQEGDNADNSNIVVLYSHPVDGQQGQFITSQGNLLVNSQTGMLELRNGTTITTTSSNQIVMNSTDVETPIESIEMIQREIENQRDLKQESFYEDRKQTTMDNESQTKQIVTEENVLEELAEDQVIINDFTEYEEITESSNKEVSETQNEGQKENHRPEQNPEIYLTQETCEEHVDNQDEIILNQESSNIDTNQTEIKNNDSLQSEMNEGNEIDLDKEANLEISNKSGPEVQDSTDGNQEEPMEIEEIHSVEVTAEKPSEVLHNEEPMEETIEMSAESAEEQVGTADDHPIEEFEEVNTIAQGFDVPPESEAVPPEDNDLPPENIDDPPESIDVPPESTDVLPERIDVPPKSIDVIPEVIDVPPESIDVPPDNIEGPPQSIDVPLENNDVLLDGNEVSIEDSDVPFEDHEVESKSHDVPSEGHDVPPGDNNITCESHDIPPEVYDMSLKPKQQVEQSQNTESIKNPSEKVERTESNNETHEVQMEVDGSIENNLTETNEVLIQKDETQESDSITVTEECVDENVKVDEEQCGTQDIVDISSSEQAEDEDSQFIEEKENTSETTKSQNTCRAKTNTNINKEILEDWEEDTDSQQSEKQNTPKDSDHQEEVESENSKDGQRQAAVDKLMNDWEDEDEEDKRD